MKQGKILKTVRSQRGKVVSLEPFSFNRLKEFYQLYLSSKHEWEKFLVLHFNDVNNAQNFIAQQYNNDKFTGYFVIQNDTNKLVGFIFGDEVGADVIMTTRATGCTFEKQGYGFEARQLFENIMKKAGYSSILSSCDTDNIRSIELLQRAGYEFQKKEHVCFGPVSMDFVFYCKKL